jgi:ribosome-binding protein aMBF1 (putative translation factor)
MPLPIQAALNGALFWARFSSANNSLDMARMIRVLCATMNATLSLTRDDVHARLRDLGWSQNELARRIRKDPGMVSRVLRGQVTSAVVWGRIERLLTREAAKQGAA